MKPVIAAALITSMLFPARLLASDAAPATLREAITAAVTKNKTAQTTDELLESISLSTKAAKAAMLPSGGVSCSAGWDKSSSQIGIDPTVRTSGRSTSCSASVSYTIYDGHAGRASYMAAKLAEEATRYAYDSTDSHMTNTKGGLAYSTYTSYMMLVKMKMRLNTFNRVLAALNAFKKFSSDSTLTQEITDIQTSVQSFKNAIDSSTDSIKFYMTIYPSDELETIEETLDSLTVPPTADAAVTEALSRGPDVKRRNLELESAKWSLKAIRASVGPRVSANASISQGNSNYRINADPYGPQTHSANKSVGLTVSLPLNVGSYYEIQAAKMRLKSKESENKAAMDSAEYSIRSTYKSLLAAQTQEEVLKKNVREAEDLVQSDIDRINNGDTAGMEIDKLLRHVSNWVSRTEMLLMSQDEIAQLLFSINQVTGRLFTDFVKVDTSTH